MIPRCLAQRASRLASTSAFSARRFTTLARRQNLQPATAIATVSRQEPSSRPQPLHLNKLKHTRYASTSAKSPATPPQNTPAGDAAVETLTELYATAYDEFEIATESTEANATYAEEDRNAAREELENVLAAYRKVVEEDGDAALAEEVRRRVGQRVRELEQGVKAMEERAMEGD